MSTHLQEVKNTIHKGCGGDIQFIVLSNSSKTRVRCMRCLEENDGYLL